MEAPERASLRRALLIFAIVVVIGSGVSFMTGMNMVATAASERSSSHPKGPKEQRAPVVKPSEKVQEQLMPGLIELRLDGAWT